MTHAKFASMTDDYMRCVVEYTGDVNELKTDGTAFIEASTVYGQLEDLKWEGDVRDISHGTGLRYPETGETVPLPVSFEVKKDALNGKNLPDIGSSYKTLDDADRWDWKPLNAEEFERYQREQRREDGYRIFTTEDELDMEIQTRDAETAQELADSPDMVEVTE